MTIRSKSLCGRNSDGLAEAAVCRSGSGTIRIRYSLLDGDH